jgi:hypothetical protein
MNDKGEPFIVEDVEELEKKNVTHLWTPRVVTGGKGPTGSNWLAQLREGTVFLVKPKQSGGFAEGQFHVIHNLDTDIHLMDNMGHQEVHMWVDSSAFSSQFDLRRILYEPEDGSSQH